MRRTACLLALLSLGALPLGAEPPKKPPKKPPVEETKVGVPDSALQEAINAAIDKGAAFLRSQQKPNGAYAPVVVHTQAVYQIGCSALCGLALLACGDPPMWRSPKKPPVPEAVDRVMAFVKEIDLKNGAMGARTTYEAGSLAMFVTEYYRMPPVEVKPQGHTQQTPGSKNPCNLPPDAMAWLQDLATWLCQVQKDTGGWGYPGNREDFSNTQYALLGLRAARDCGATVPATVFEKALKMALQWQQQDGPKVKRIVPSGDPTATPYVFEAGDRARGFPYLQGPTVPSTGSMTTSGIAILSIAHDALMRPKRLSRFDPPLENQTTHAIEDAFCWLDKNWTVARNPGADAPNWHLYFLYGLERSGALAGRGLIGQHDWYVEGAKHIVGMQKPDGRWSTGALGGGETEGSDVLDTAWALLFLKRATRPAPPIAPPNVTEGD